VTDLQQRTETQPKASTGILLAAGNSQRFGRDKLLEPVTREGTPMVLASALKLRAASARLLIVIRPEQHEVQQVLSRNGLSPLICTRARRGMGHSLACGITASITEGPWIIALADQPFIPPLLYLRISRELHQYGGIVRPCYKGRPGHPVGFAPEFGEKLQNCTGDHGARHIIKSHQAETRYITTDHPGIVADIDRPSDLAPFRLM